MTSNDDEIWRQIDNTYRVSSHGRVYSAHSKKYLRGSKIKIHLHQHLRSHLVAKFIPNPENFRCVRHLDGDTTNCHVSNLEWCAVGAGRPKRYKKPDRDDFFNSDEVLSPLDIAIEYDVDYRTALKWMKERADILHGRV